jgi:hypothetical protein
MHGTCGEDPGGEIIKLPERKKQKSRSRDNKCSRSKKQKSRSRENKTPGAEK